MSSILGDEPDMDVIQAQNPSATADPIKTVSSGVKRQQRMAASLMTRNWDDPTLSEKGLLGL